MSVTQGLIPARAGSTSCCSPPARAPRAHPRSRGEHSAGLQAVLAGEGSSPLARGARGELDIGAGDRGLIPARAGSTSAHRSAGCTRRAHPRSRGEHSRPSRTDSARGGSSPLARGARPLTWGSRSAFRAHPRSRGEHSAARTGAPHPRGSSPLARGARCLRRAVDRCRGLIPARAGSTKSHTMTCTSDGAHPRSRGEHRGRRKPSSRISGLIPARAGSTLIDLAVC